MDHTRRTKTTFRSITFLGSVDVSMESLDLCFGKIETSIFCWLVRDQNKTEIVQQIDGALCVPQKIDILEFLRLIVRIDRFFKNIIRFY